MDKQIKELKNIIKELKNMLKNEYNNDFDIVIIKLDKNINKLQPKLQPKEKMINSNNPVLNIEDKNIFIYI